MKETPLHEEHIRLGARMIDFFGFHMPVQYSSIIDEVDCVRQRVGIFDLCHMGRIVVAGPDREDVVKRAVTKNIEKVPVGAARYGLLLTPEGTIKDDVLVYREEEAVHVVINCSNRERDHQHFLEHGEGKDARVENVSDEQTMIALQGRGSQATLAPLTDVDLADLGYYRFTRATVAGVADVLLSRTGYTGEDGFELFFGAEEGPAVWRKIVESGEAHGLGPIGLGARDVLRLEAAMPLYGQELTLELNPFEADVGFGVSMKSDFTGKEALRTAKQEGVAKKRVGFVVNSKRIPRPGMDLFGGDERIGQVTSGTFSPTLDRNIGMGYVTIGHEAVGTRIDVEAKGKRHPAEVVELPFYKRER
ncbi:MAG: glycine cleavage system aminomethyltransferase GcvT [Planctomycetota bacterium]|jgi:aminomethyltransferase